MRVTFAFLFTNLVDDISLGVCFGWLFEMSRKCVNAIDSFCYICGEFTSKTQKVSMTPLVKKAYELYFGCKVGDQDKVWAPHICCKHCAVNLRGWVQGTALSMPFAVPMVWREQKDHYTDCYFCLTKISGVSFKHRKSITYPNLPSAMRPVSILTKTYKLTWENTHKILS